MPTLQTYIVSTFWIAAALALLIFATAVLRTWGSEPHAEMSQAEQPELAWWVKVDTANPQCTYYFGPFASTKEAELSQPGYLEDLEQEGAQGVAVQIQQCQPSNLTVFA